MNKEPVNPNSEDSQDKEDEARKPELFVFDRSLSIDAFVDAVEAIVNRLDDDDEEEQKDQP
jgi:hypothetical protein